MPGIIEIRNASGEVFLNMIGYFLLLVNGFVGYVVQTESFAYSNADSLTEVLMYNF